jgi:hypothetical protein
VSYDKIRSILEGRLRAFDAFPTAWENVSFAPTSGQPYQRAALLPGQTQGPTMGDGFKRELGVLQVDLYYPTGSGPKEATARAEALRGLFPRGWSASSGPVLLRIVPHPYMSPARIEDGWYRVSVSIPYTADIQP